MKIIDVTLRDGGHAVKFNWSLKLAQDLYSLMSSVKTVKYVELGYWKQKSKSLNKFYDLDYNYISKITKNKNLNNVSIMIDYHYCSKNLKDYPTSNQKKISMIRVCSRKNDVKQALEFCNKLKKYTNLKISFNLFNTSNYTRKELLKYCKMISQYNVDYVYFADTHGCIDFSKIDKIFKPSLKIFKDKKIKFGMHLHDHSGKGYFNYRLINKFGFTMADSSIRGMGKGFGNLRTEFIIDKKYYPKLLNLITKYEDQLTMYQNPYTLITARYSVSDNYATQAKKLNYNPILFDAKISKLKNLKKDNFDSNYLIK
jgi:4-hydroxy 2-oxovalerate aldolase